MGKSGGVEEEEEEGEGEGEKFGVKELSRGWPLVWQGSKRIT
jgi:hypothetical protein